MLNFSGFHFNLVSNWHRMLNYISFWPLLWKILSVELPVPPFRSKRKRKTIQNIWVLNQTELPKYSARNPFLLCRNELIRENTSVRMHTECPVFSSLSNSRRYFVNKILKILIEIMQRKRKYVIAFLATNCPATLKTISKEAGGKVVGCWLPCVVLPCTF